ncbi:MAG: DUF721 domain-containing protein [Bdellovibrionales bacterium]|nr:DUF721 domain-containing protein [Bdellovibrionales bacterium]
MSFRSLKDILMGSGLTEPFRKRLKEAEAVSRWDSAVGPIIAKHAQAVRVDAGILYVEVGHPIWRSELHHRRRQILEILNQGASDQTAILKDLHFIDPRATHQDRNIADKKADKIAKKTQKPG